MTRCLPLLVAALLLGIAGPAAIAQEQSVEVEAADLLGDPAAWDGRRVVLTGELVGDYSPRADGVWVQVNDDAFVGRTVGSGGNPDTVNLGVGARIPISAFAHVQGPPGRYGRHGPVVRLEGVFLHSDPGLQGETYLDVDTARTLQAGRPYPVPGPDLWLPVGVLAMGAAGAVTWLGRRSAGGDV